MNAEKRVRDFIRAIIDEDLRTGRRSKIITRFPPEPNGFPHIGHAKSITLNFGLAIEYGGTCHLRFDDTNPATEDQRYVDAIKSAVSWLGFEWEGKEFYASDYFEQLYDWACQLINKGLAYVDDLSEDEIRAGRGTVTEPGYASPCRDRSVSENLNLFARMRDGEFTDGTHVLRAKIDMAHPNMKMRDPLMYRIRHAHHYRQGDAWCIYPFYDWAHGQSDAIEGITHSICTLEFVPNRTLYDWYLDALEISPRPYQYEFARLNLGHTITSKRKLLRLVEEGFVDGWDDPRMPSLAGARRRGVTPAAIRSFCEAVGTTKVDGVNDPDLLDHHIRDDLNHKAPRVMCVTDPIKVRLLDYPVNKTEYLDAPYWPHDIAKEGTRKVPFSSALFIERSDFAEDPPKKFKRLSPGACVRLRYAYVIRCVDFEKNARGEVTEVVCSWYPESRSGGKGGGPKPRGTIHWVDASASLCAEVRLYERLFTEEHPDRDFLNQLNPASKVVYDQSRIEPSIAHDPPDTRYQFTRVGYFWRDPAPRPDGSLVFNRIAPLRDSWTKKKAAPPAKTTTAVAPKKSVTLPPAPAPSLREEDQAWVDHHGIDESTGRTILRYPGGKDFFEAAVTPDASRPLALWMANHLLRISEGRPLASLPLSPESFATLVKIVTSKQATTHEARRVLDKMIRSGGDPLKLLKENRKQAIDDPDTLRKIVLDLLDQYPDKASAYRNGKKGLLGFFIGQTIRATKGEASPHTVRALVLELLDSAK